MSSAKEAVAYMKAIHQLVTYLDVSDGNMAQGSLRCDANVSIRKKDDKELGTRTEIKILILLNLLKKLSILRLKDRSKFLKVEKKLFKKQDFTIAPKMKLAQCDQKNLQMTIGIFQNQICFL